MYYKNINIMYNKATKFFLDYSNNPAKYDYPEWSVNLVQIIPNVWSWCPDDISKFSVILQAETRGQIWIIYENWNHENVITSWSCLNKKDLKQAIQEIKTKYL